MQRDTQPVSTLVGAFMLRMAGAWQSQGQVNRAVDVYLRIVRQRPESPEAEEAREKLLAQAVSFEQDGRFHLAMDLYERIEEACRC